MSVSPGTNQVDWPFVMLKETDHGRKVRKCCGDDPVSLRCSDQGTRAVGRGERDFSVCDGSGRPGGR